MVVGFLRVCYDFQDRMPCFTANPQREMETAEMKITTGDLKRAFRKVLPASLVTDAMVRYAAETGRIDTVRSPFAVRGWHHYQPESVKAFVENKLQPSDAEIVLRDLGLDTRQTRLSLAS